MPRTVVVTGGTQGIGAAIAARFHRAGDFVVIGARRDNGFAASLGGRALFVEADVTRAADHRRLVEAARKATDRLDVYINNAGRSQWMSLENVTEDFWSAMLDVNAKSVLWGAQAAARALQPGGCILNISSLAGKRGSANNSVYCASKFAVNGITQALAKELGPRGIRVNAICPVLVRTPGLVQALGEAPAPAGGDPDAFLAGFTQANAALGHLPTADQVAEFCQALVESQGVTGQCVNVDCGVFPQ
jgi:3-oxoacyl-[acyl-carrier protein] reductase/meso-butanediol dehydrogenase/(S,S)-butanediol dehydrogenase/diacetyl reductase